MHLIFKIKYPRLKLMVNFKTYLNLILNFNLFFINNGIYTKKLVFELSKLLDSNYIIFTNSARISIYLILKNLIKKNQYVVMSPYTIADVVNMVICAGGIPLFVDLDSNTCNISYSKAEALIDRNNNIGAILITHFYGLVGDVESFRKLSLEKNIPLIEDAAQSFGAKLNGKYSGTFGTAGVFSFGLFKNISSFYGGAIVTDDEVLFNKINNDLKYFKNIKLQFFLNKVLYSILLNTILNKYIFSFFTFWIFRYGLLNNIDAINNKLKIDVNPTKYTKIPNNYLYKPSDLQAFLILDKLKLLNQYNNSRICNASKFTSQLSGINQVRFPPAVNYGRNIFWYLPLMCDDRESLVKYAAIHGIDLTVSYHRNCASIPSFSDYFKKLEQAELTANSVVYLPTYPSYPEIEIYKVCSIISEYFSQEGMNVR